MLKSHFRIQQDEEEEEIVEEEELESPMKVEGEIEEKEELDHRPLHKSEISVRLSWLAKTAEGDGYAYIKAQCTHMRLTEITIIKTFKHLQFVNLSHNFLTTEALQVVTELPHILLIHADKNKLETANLKRCQYLQVIIFNHNFITSMEEVYQSKLRTLELGYNQINEIKLKHRMPTIRFLDLRYNRITEIGEMLDFPKLDSLYLAGNKITTLVGIERLQNLRVLHVRNNPIRFLNGFETELPKLEYLNLRNCKIGTLRQVKKLRGQTALKALVLKGTPFMGGSGKEDPEAPDEPEEPEVRIEVLAALPRLNRLNKDVFTPEERQDAKDLQAQWLEEGEKDEEEEIVEEGHMEEEHQEET